MMIEQNRQSLNETGAFDPKLKSTAILVTTRDGSHYKIVGMSKGQLKHARRHNNTVEIEGDDGSKVQIEGKDIKKIEDFPEQ